MVASKWNGTTPTANDISQSDDWLLSNFGETWGYLANGGKGSGTEPPELASLARNYFGLTEATEFSGWTLEQLKQELAQGYPVIVRVRPQMVASYPSAHYMVLLGIDQEWVYVNDPGIRPGAQAKYKLQDFIDSWARTAQWDGENNEGVSIHQPGGGGIQWLVFFEGNPEIPGDGKIISSGPSIYPGSVPPGNFYFQPDPAIPLGNLSSGFTLTVFPVGGISFPYSVGFHTLTLSPSPGCPILGTVANATFYAGSPIVTFNGIQGVAISFAQSELSTMVALNNAYLAKYYPSCPALSLSSFSLTDIYLNNGTTSEIDGVAFAPGQNIVPSQ